MNNFELIDDYLTNRLSAEQVRAFEKQLASDPALKADVELQRHILEGIRKSRAAELKGMLNKVPVGGGSVIDFPVMKLAAGLILVSVIGAVAYFSTRSGEVPMKNATTDLIKKGEKIQQKNEAIVPNVVEEKSDVTGTEAPKNIAPENKPSETKKSTDKTVIKPAEQTSAKPNVQVQDVTGDLNDTNNEPGVSETMHNSGISVSHIAVETDLNNKNYQFHYQFAGGKLYLYGPFDKNLYEILEINGDKQTVFLFYKENFYLLDGRQIEIARLQPITDTTLIRKLKAYRNK